MVERTTRNENMIAAMKVILIGQFFYFVNIHWWIVSYVNTNIRSYSLWKGCQHFEIIQMARNNYKVPGRFLEVWLTVCKFSITGLRQVQHWLSVNQALSEYCLFMKVIQLSQSVWCTPILVDLAYIYFCLTFKSLLTKSNCITKT